MGIVPATDARGISGGFIGMTDYMAIEALDHLGLHEALASPIKFALAQRDSEQICLYLKEHPQSLRITGPNPAAGPGWLLAAGCPRTIVKPDDWISLQLDPAWLARSPWQDGVWTYPTIAEVDAARGNRLTMATLRAPGSR